MQALQRMLQRIALVVAVAVCGFVMMVTPAFAREYSIDKVDIDATIDTDGSLTVVEMRTFDFDGHFNGVYWDIAKGEYEGRDIEVDVLAAGIMEGDSFTPFKKSDSEDNNTYSVTERSSYVELKIFSAHDDEEARFVIKYRLTNAVGRYADVAELYWKFVSDGWDVESQNVTCVVHLPVPEGESVVPEKNVRAWGHGPLDAEVAFDGDDVVYTVPGVGTSEFAEARITFPEEWASDTPLIYEEVLDEVLSEEMAWAEEANELREQAIQQQRTLNTVGTGGFVAGLAGAIGAVAFAFSKKKTYKETHKPQFDDEYFRDVPTGDHPAVLGTLANDATMPDEALTAALMRLTDQGIIKLEKRTFTKDRFLLGDTQYEDYCIILNQQDYIVEPIRGKVAQQAHTIDVKAYDFLGWLARKDGGDPLELQFSSIKRTAKKNAEKYQKRYDEFKDKVEETYERRFSSDEPTGSAPVGVVSVIAFLLGCGLIFLAMMWEISTLLPYIGGGALIVAGIICGFTAVGFDKLNAEGIEVRAKLEALKRWFEDFTRLKEAVPHDVILWNRLLVMAVALGVSEEVIKQLKIVAPEILNDPYMHSMYYWYFMDSRLGTPASAFAGAMQEAHSVSQAALSESSFSSGGGGGGGFSGGGGGGFGGGGGGGAF